MLIPRPGPFLNFGGDLLLISTSRELVLENLFGLCLLLYSFEGMSSCEILVITYL